MTLLGIAGFQPKKKRHLLAPACASSRDISIVMPVKNNQAGVLRFLGELQRTHTSAFLPREVIIVDNNSQPPISIPKALVFGELSVTVLRCSRPGPASARNLGIKHARSLWVLFTDSDCVPTSTLLSGYFSAMDGSVGYAGAVKAWGKDVWSRYYESQEILAPTTTYEEGTARPEYLITANALVWRSALEEIEGFNETIEIAAGEDIDLGFRLREIGMLAYAPDAVAYHDFAAGLPDFIHRFVRYGKGNKRISKLHNLDLTPGVFSAKKPSALNWLLARLQYHCLSWGYKTGKDERAV